ncbi:hypothetical protein HY492_00425 [Candidatus Woesearchaeota archaeon]|nr:hypothetical protein [Candidatus Woesearchaeota archaeon]
MDIVKMSTKGQLVVPEGIRQQERFNPGDRFIPLPVKEGVLFTRVSMPAVEELNKLAREVQRQFKRNRVTPRIITEAVTWARKS